MIGSLDVMNLTFSWLKFDTPPSKYTASSGLDKVTHSTLPLPQRFKISSSEEVDMVRTCAFNFFRVQICQAGWYIVGISVAIEKRMNWDLMDRVTTGYNMAAGSLSGQSPGFCTRQDSHTPPPVHRQRDHRVKRHMWECETRRLQA